MIATALDVTETTALVELRPCWIARWFGARTVQVRLTRKANEKYASKPYEDWLTEAGRQDLGHVRHGAAILRALDFRPAGQLPRAAATRCEHGVESPRREGRVSCLRCVTARDAVGARR